MSEHFDDPAVAAAYRDLLEKLRTRVAAGRLGAALAANRELILLYWDIGLAILERQAEVGWGAKVVDRLADDLRSAFPDMKGFSPRNLRYMRTFAATWSPAEFGQQTAAQIPWGHHIVLLDKVRDESARLFYAQATADHGWSRAVLAVQIETKLHERQGRALTNFGRTLPPPTSDLARSVLKDPYVFEFLALAEDASERELEQGLIDHVQRFLLELGVGFAFVGRQHRLEVGGDEFYLDLLFYHLRLRCFVVIELKTVSFQPEFVGKLNFYLSAVDAQLRHPDDKPTIGLLLCKDKNRVVVEYTLRDVEKPMGIASWQAGVAGALPSVEQLERELSSDPSGSGVC